MQAELIQHIKQAHEAQATINGLRRRVQELIKIKETPMGRKKDVAEFQTEVLKVEYPSKPLPLSLDDLQYNIKCVTEELQELADAKTLPDMADAVVDAQYFLEGILYKMGIDSDRVWAEVHRANMDKHRGKTHRGVDSDAAKPDDWRPPNHDWITQ